MTPQEIRAIRLSWAQVVPISEQAATHFYDRLFEIDPATRPLFGSTDMANQKRKLMDIINTVVNALDAIEAVLPNVKALGRRHAGYNVDDAHYDSVGAALLWALEKCLVDEWTEETAAAWSKAYMLLSSTMRDASAEVRAA